MQKKKRKIQQLKSFLGRNAGRLWAGLWRGLEYCPGWKRRICFHDTRKTSHKCCAVHGAMWLRLEGTDVLLTAAGSVTYLAGRTLLFYGINRSVQTIYNEHCLFCSLKVLRTKSYFKETRYISFHCYPRQAAHTEYHSSTSLFCGKVHTLVIWY